MREFYEGKEFDLNDFVESVFSERWCLNNLMEENKIKELKLIKEKSYKSVLNEFGKQRIWIKLNETFEKQHRINCREILAKKMWSHI